jgi:general stress protein 26
MAGHDSIDPHLARVWDIIDAVGVGMLTTHLSTGLRSRPLEARLDRAASLIWFVTDVRGGKDDEIDHDPDVGFVVIDAKANAYLSLTGTARVTRDPAKAKEIWHKTDDVWWPGGPDDPNVRVICLTPSLAELWDGPSSMLVVTYEFAKARITGTKPNLGENRKTTVQIR